MNRSIFLVMMLTGALFSMMVPMPVIGAVLPPEYKEFVFDDGAIEFSNRFESGRLNQVTQTGRNHFLITIEPENHPINDSPWYAFSVVAKTEREIVLRFRYRHGKHRYHPKISNDGIRWQAADLRHYQVDKEGEARLALTVGPDKQWVAAQELTYSMFGLKQLIDGFSQHQDITHAVFGESVEGRPLSMLKVGSNNARHFVLVLGRQHPPEVTGSIAQMAFLRTLSGDSPLAKRFRQSFTTLAFPLLNPDGVMNGHWRHNANGVDLNRDWYQQSQPEIQAVAGIVDRIAANPANKIWFALDFHSTHHDIFYTVERDLANDQYQIVDRWLARLWNQDIAIKDRPGNLRRGVSKSWLQKQWGIPALTYEVGDETDRTTIATIGDRAAVAMMEELLKSIGSEKETARESSLVRSN
ncbi:hypothetical protein HBA55_06070 [Pseudomaricurvus alkylphenolicus]|uniref:M14-type cytosolic carboxypeptidase n=1 Tax=Pseudomaricurvus alkylphenolicus TaxID=1306991 RepID=UPI0014244BC2|nr:hypothetical protein [Pseudomaricurvus alkylphenolicus]